MKETATHHLSKPVGEVVQASTTEITSHCYRLYEAPPLGTLVKSGQDDHIYGVVGEVMTQSIDRGRRPVAVGEDEESEEAIYRSNPQLNRLLSTEFRSIVVGYRTNVHLYRYLAPLPPKIHSFTYMCDSDEVVEFIASLDFLSILITSSVGSQDDVIASFLRQASLCHPDPQHFLIDAGKELATLLSGQSQRLNGLLRRLST